MTQDLKEQLAAMRETHAIISKELAYQGRQFAESASEEPQTSPSSDLSALVANDSEFCRNLSEGFNYFRRL